MEHPVISTLKDKIQKSIHTLESKYDGVRTGRASARMFENIMVNNYGSPTPLNQVASIRVQEARQVVIQAWDNSLLVEIEKAIQKDTVSINPINDGKLIRIQIPPLTDTTRKESVTHAYELAEDAKIAIRNIRRDAIDKMKKLQHSSEISEDDLSHYEKIIQTEVEKATHTITTIASEKEKEIMEE